MKQIVFYLVMFCQICLLTEILITLVANTNKMMLETQVVENKLIWNYNEQYIMILDKFLENRNDIRIEVTE